MSLMYFDTLKFSNRLKAAGIPAAHAEAEAEALAEVLDVNLKDLATKADLAAAKSELKVEIAELRKDMEHSLTLLEQRMVVKLGAMIAIAIGVTATLVKLL